MRFILTILILLIPTLSTAVGKASDIDRLIQDAKAGNLEAQFNLGVMYYQGELGVRDYNNAIKWMEMAANQGDVEAIFYAGLFNYETGKTRAALHHFENAVKGDSPQAHWFLAKIYEKGDEKNSIPKLMEQAKEHYIKSAELGFPQAQYMIGLAHEYGRMGFKVDPYKALQWYEKAALGKPSVGFSGLKEAQFKAGNLYHKGNGVIQNYKKALDYYTMSAEQGYLQAMNNLGVMYLEGLGMVRSPGAAFEMFDKAALGGNMEAQYNLGTMYDKGVHVKRNDEQAFFWYEKAAQKGHALSKHNIGIMFFEGRGVEKNIAKALKMFEQSAKDGSLSAQKFLAHFYSKGEGEIEPNPLRTLSYLEMAASQGDSNSQYMLGYYYYYGKGVNKDLTKAEKWFKIAAKNDNKQAKEVLKNMRNLDYQPKLGIW